MAGFTIRDAQGRVTFELTDRMVVLMGSVVITADNTSGYLDIPETVRGHPFYYCSFSEDGGEGIGPGRSIELKERRLEWLRMPLGSLLVWGIY
ncbi:hypothetical protein [Pseudomonas cremoricolorata]|uniref:Uncharacterized protein n=1 Tax=Pseudomonas cremoricolorata TaxID=157783 RepID=A0A089YGC5_9PSED|nr:hypothetical protein [Pseudomonas cremoricolorata]AIR90763.1 hypothetical protein LK03_16475 [Pseudomonas cremoricolorata]